MIEVFAHKRFVWLSLLAFLLTFAVCTFIVNPQIDGKDGSGLLALQLAFDKEVGIKIIESWGAEGRAFYQRWSFTDYIYAAAYSIFLASLLSSLAVRTGKSDALMFFITPLIALSAGVFDCAENSLEAAFINNPATFSADLFYFHSIIALCKWAAIGVALMTIFILALQCLVLAVSQHRQ
ncbi:hypothetical protein SAMN02745165_01981 [Malonomonas rubra DSM 5091]|uniref:Uncharacterized protein n=1 Tax=Malonomonas rubra DSM 5091 TaxID=1122189 RepID=A0A1M6I2H7_MALRU|nr:hypothetical protein [Malonomonas rubra]SHJ28580.1 hypothetical protein SAMN02745165_01981 [Malonomonas rubra DSM 5091]